jgi:signal transduction histidine kinase
MGDTLFKLLEEMGASHAEVVKTNQALTENLQNLSMLNEVTKALQSTLDLDQILHIILTGVTAAEILRLNRAFLLLLDENEKNLSGVMAVGPTGPDEASKIWNELKNSQVGFKDLALRPHREIEGNEYVNRLVREIKIPLDDYENVAIQAINHRRSFLITDAYATQGAKAFAAVLNVSNFVVVPLIAENEPLGVLMADNAITQTPILQEDLTLLEIFAGQVASAIRNAKLYQQLQLKINELRDSQDKLIKAEKMASIGEIATTLAHEMRTPLVSIGGFINSMIRQQPPGHPYDKQLKIISSEIERLETVLSDTLEMARFKEPELVRADINTMIEDCLKLLSPEFEDKGIEVQSSYLCPEHLVWLDKLQLPQVFLNIFKNAIHAMPDGGLLRVETVMVPPSNIEIRISDTGQGIRKDHLDKIFEPKFTTKNGGSGIGLVVSKRIINSHRGQIWVEPRPERGITFIINLPLVQQT